MDGVWRPVVSGLVGGLVTTGLFFFMRDRVSRSFEGRDVVALIKRYRWHIRFVDTAFLATLIAGVFVYQANWVASNDWRPLALMFGGGAVIPFLSVYLWVRVRDGAAFTDFLVAIAAHDGAPLWLLHGVLLFCTGVLGMGIAGYVFGKGY